MTVFRREIARIARTQMANPILRRREQRFRQCLSALAYIHKSLGCFRRIFRWLGPVASFLSCKSKLHYGWECHFWARRCARKVPAGFSVFLRSSLHAGQIQEEDSTSRHQAPGLQVEGRAMLQTATRSPLIRSSQGKPGVCVCKNT